MLKSIHADILNKPYSQIKELKLYHAHDLEKIKADHKSAWQVFKAFNLKIYENLPAPFAKPHIQNWCNGWEIRRHFFAYYKYECYLGNAPIIVVILNRQRLIAALTWHGYKADVSNSTLKQFNRWTDEICWRDFQDFYVWHSRINEYGDFLPVSQFDDGQVLADGEFYRLGRYLPKEMLDVIGDEALMDWVLKTIQALSVVYEQCHGVKSCSANLNLC